MARVALVGAGYIAQTHGEVLASLPEVEVHSICDVDENRARSLARRFGVESIHGSVSSLLASSPVPDAVHVIVPPPLHVEVAEPILAAGIPVFLEKPMALSRNDSQRLVGAASKAGVSLGVNHNILFHPQMLRLFEDIEAGKIGPIQHVSASVSMPLRQLQSGQIGHWMFRDPKNLVLELLPHTFSILQRLLGPVRTVETSVVGRRILSSGAVLPKTWHLTLVSERGTAQVFFSPGGEFEEWWIHVLGEDGSRRADLTYDLYETRERTKWLPAFDQYLVGTRSARSMRRDAARGFFGYAKSKIGWGGRTDAFFVAMRGSIRGFHEACRRGSRPPVGGEDGLEVVEYCEKTLETPALSSYRAAGENSKEEAQERRVVGERSGAQTEAVPKLLVTGATGFIGGHVVERLLENGQSVRTLLRRSSGLPSWLGAPGVERIHGELTSKEKVKEAVSGVDSVLHLATGGGESWGEIEASMVGGAIEMANACLENSCRLVFVSSIAALYLGDPQAVITEETPPDPQPEKRALYARGKAAAERALQDLAVREGLRLTIVRPGVVIGRRGSPYHSGVGYWINSQHCLGFSMGYHPLALVLVTDVADALIAAGTQDNVDGHCLNLVGDVRWNSREYVRRLAEACRRPLEFHPTSPATLQTVDSLKWIVKRLGGQRVPFPSLRDFKSRGLASRFDCTKTKELLGWRPVAEEERFFEEAIRCHFSSESGREG